jgi:2,3-bisphosphoglycerate-independent phosphoglycerate mutase
MGDLHRGPLGNATPLELAEKPNMDYLAQHGLLGTIATVDEGFKPGSDIANLSVMGYDPKECYTGRSSLEALSIGVNVGENDACLRTNLVTLGEAEKFEDRTMDDYSAGEISTEEAAAIIATVNEKMSNGIIEFYSGVSYRHCALLHDSKNLAVEFTPPHDISGKKIGEYLPKGDGSAIFIELIKKSTEILKDHPVNIERVKNGKRPANAVWFWGKGTKPKLENFESKYHLKAAMISATDLLRGIAVGAGMDVIKVENATGTLNTNFLGKAQACVDAADTHDYVYVHFEAPDECGHQGDAQGKILSIEKIDGVIGYIREKLAEKKVDYCMAVLPDHLTPLCMRTHLGEPVPFIVYNSLRPAECGLARYTEKEAQKGIYLSNGRALLQLMMKS